jgi:hypothetical protein
MIGVKQTDHEPEHTIDINVELQPLNNNYTSKVKLIKSILDDIKKRKDAHYKNFGVYKNLSMYSKSLINTLNAISICSIVVNFTPINPGVIILALSSTTLSGLTSALQSAIDLDFKTHSHNTSYLQYGDAYREVSARLLKNGLTSDDLDLMLYELNNRLNIIEDSSLPIKI